MQNYIKYFFYDKNCGHIFLVCAPTLFIIIGLSTNLSLIFLGAASFLVVSFSSFATIVTSLHTWCRLPILNLKI